MEEYKFYAFKSALLYKEIGNDAKVLVKFIPCVLTHFDAPHSVKSDRGLTFRVFSNEF